MFQIALDVLIVGLMKALLEGMGTHNVALPAVIVATIDLAVTYLLGHHIGPHSVVPFAVAALLVLIAVGNMTLSHAVLTTAALVAAQLVEPFILKLMFPF